MAVDYIEVLDPNELKDYTYDWTLALGTDTIVSSVVAMVEANSVTISSNSNGTATTTVWLTGGTPGKICLFTVRVTTVAGRILEQAFRVSIVETKTVPTESETLAAMLVEAKSARHKLATGATVVDVMRDGRKIAYSKTTIQELDAYIRQLEREIAIADNVAAGRQNRSAIRIVY